MLCLSQFDMLVGGFKYALMKFPGVTEEDCLVAVQGNDDAIQKSPFWFLFLAVCQSMYTYAYGSGMFAAFVFPAGTL